MNQRKPTNPPNPRWWNEDYDTSWRSARDNVRRNWLDNDPVAGDWESNEPAVRYGYGASRQYQGAHASWDDRAEAKLKEEWTDLKSGRTWEEIKDAVKRGWDAARGGRSSER